MKTPRDPSPPRGRLRPRGHLVLPQRRRGGSFPRLIRDPEEGGRVSGELVCTRTGLLPVHHLLWVCKGRHKLEIRFINPGCV